MTDGLRYTPDHEYIRLMSGKIARVGIAPYAIEALGGIIAVTLPVVGQVARAGECIAVFESVKAACEVFAPASGVVTAINDSLVADPAIVNSDPTGAGWFFAMELADPAELARLFDATAYAAYLGGIKG
ncbi:glycine cleavage system protein H [Pseudochelatococcus contaminans]|uniref:Glycine cleavage system H protein n=1 Tax=Pseudochelatococcus contaminans TaxID=1538103 RepID=A0A7W5Z3N8_9HYPH|nr:glycine cleavage system H protein [Pseudochelatococcus contaminans]MBB3809502.1 glycine cleavage system H protein [Pseudochelatococcus contaminans]